MQRITAEQFRAMQQGTAARAPRTATPRNKPKEREEPEQIAFINWMANALPETFEYTFHPANGGKRHVATAKRMKALGQKKGVPDLFMDLPKYDPETGRPYFGMRAEFKATPPHNSALSTEQKAWLARLSRRGYFAVPAKGLAELQRLVTWYANLPDLEVSQCTITN